MATGIHEREYKNPSNNNKTLTFDKGLVNVSPVHESPFTPPYLFNQELFYRLQIFYTYWPYPNKMTDKKIVEFLLDGLEGKEIKTKIDKECPWFSCSFSKISRTTKKYYELIKILDFGVLSEWGPETDIPDPVFYLLKKYQLI